MHGQNILIYIFKHALRLIILRRIVDPGHLCPEFKHLGTKLIAIYETIKWPR